MSNPHPKKPKRKHPWKPRTQEAFDAELEAKRIKLTKQRVGYDERSHGGHALFGTGRGLVKK
jgi:hypothetical protein